MALDQALTTLFELALGERVGGLAMGVALGAARPRDVHHRGDPDDRLDDRRDRADGDHGAVTPHPARDQIAHAVVARTQQLTAQRST